jgi:hypothetical protein
MLCRCSIGQLTQTSLNLGRVELLSEEASEKSNSHEDHLEQSGIITGRKPVTISYDPHLCITDRLDFMTARALVNTPYAAAMVFSREDTIDEILASKADALYDIRRALPPYIIHEPVGYVGQVCRHPLSKLVEIHPIFIKHRRTPLAGWTVNGVVRADLINYCMITKCSSSNRCSRIECHRCARRYGRRVARNFRGPDSARIYAIVITAGIGNLDEFGQWRVSAWNIFTYRRQICRWWHGVSMRVWLSNDSSIRGVIALGSITEAELLTAFGSRWSVTLRHIEPDLPLFQSTIANLCTVRA